MRRERDNEGYRTHPLVKACLALSLMLTAAVITASWGFYTYVKSEEEETLRLRERCAYEAYVSLLGDMMRGESTAAAEALSRFELFSGCSADSLRAAIISDAAETDMSDIIEKLELSDRGDVITRLSDAVKRADAAAADTVRKLREEPAEAGGWAILRGVDEVGQVEALKTAADALGIDKSSLSAAENRGFPPVYTFSCKNAAVDVTRAGGRLLRLYAYRHGTAKERGEEACREAAEDFLRRAGIRDAAAVSSDEDAEGYNFIFCAAHKLGQERVLCPDEVIRVGVCRAGGVVRLFDASEYYKNKPVTYGDETISFGREKAASAVGVEGSELELIYTDGGLFWRFGGVKTLIIDVKNGDIRVQNP